MKTHGYEIVDRLNNANLIINYLISELKDLASDQYFPWHGEDAIAMRKQAQATIDYYETIANKKL